MPPSKILLKPGSLWQRVKAQTQSAIICGALHPIPTQYEFLAVQDIEFLIRILVNLKRKEEAQKKQEEFNKKNSKAQPKNPFLPYEKDLFVSDLTDTHLCLLNKFNAVEHHLLMITRDFEAQENALTLADFLAVAVTLAEIDGLVFYNSGKTAGASQPHKHLQLVPLPLVPDTLPLPLSPWIENAIAQPEITEISQLPFLHSLTSYQNLDWNAPETVAQTFLDAYQQLLKTVELTHKSPEKPDPYNLLMTREWMMVIPRSQDSYQGISINSLGFAGALLVRNGEQMEQLKQIGPLALLQNVGIEKARPEFSDT
ncbi:MAG: phosphorylase [Snowella sp.]|nr:phosphorylase [Snowella sp.]